MYGVIVINNMSKTYFKITTKNIDFQINEKMHIFVEQKVNTGIRTRIIQWIGSNTEFL